MAELETSCPPVGRHRPECKPNAFLASKTARRARRVVVALHLPSYDASRGTFAGFKALRARDSLSEHAARLLVGVRDVTTNPRAVGYRAERVRSSRKRPEMELRESSSRVPRQHVWGEIDVARDAVFDTRRARRKRIQ